MKKRMALLLCAVFAWCCVFSGTAAVEFEEPSIPMVETAQVGSVPSDTVNPDEDLVRDARILHMLELNHVFGDAIYDTDTLLEESAIALVAAAEEAENGFLYLENSLVENLVLNLYGRVTDADGLTYEGFDEQEGKMLVLPRGTEELSHNIVSVTDNEDDTLTVISCMTVNPHDDGEYTTLVCTSLAKNSSSCFGYVITDAEILG